MTGQPFSKSINFWLELAWMVHQICMTNIDLINKDVRHISRLWMAYAASKPIRLTIISYALLMSVMLRNLLRSTTILSHWMLNTCSLFQLLSTLETVIKFPLALLEQNSTANFYQLFLMSGYRKILAKFLSRFLISH